MTINEVMQIATDGMNTAQRQEEKERRLKVVEKLNKISDKVKAIDIQLKILPSGYGCCKIWKRRKANYIRQIRQIKADESAWLREVAWFLYC